MSLSSSRFLTQNLCLSLCFSLIVQGSAASAQNAPAANLSSTSASNPAQVGHNSQVSIQVAGKSVTVNSSSFLTPAEQVAVNQIISSGHQSVLLGAQGNAVGGTVNLGSDLAGLSGGLLIPH